MKKCVLIFMCKIQARQNFIYRTSGLRYIPIILFYYCNKKINMITILDHEHIFICNAYNIRMLLTYSSFCPYSQTKISSHHVMGIVLSSTINLPPLETIYFFLHRSDNKTVLIRSSVLSLLQCWFFFNQVYPY